LLNSILASVGLRVVTSLVPVLGYSVPTTQETYGERSSVKRRLAVERLHEIAEARPRYTEANRMIELFSGEVEGRRLEDTPDSLEVAF
jgi:hypothetical protein